MSAFEFLITIKLQYPDSVDLHVFASALQVSGAQFLCFEIVARRDRALNLGRQGGRA